MTEEQDGEMVDMGPWVKIKVNLKGHRKILDLQRRLKLSSQMEALGVVVSLFIETFNCEWLTGDWTKWHPEDVEKKIGWVGKPGELIEGLRGSGFLDGMKVHDWKKIQRQQIKDRIRRNTTTPARTFGGRPIPVDDSNELAIRTKRLLAEKDARNRR